VTSEQWSMWIGSDGFVIRVTEILSKYVTVVAYEEKLFLLYAAQSDLLWS